MALRNRLLFLFKLSISALIMVWIGRMVFSRGQSEDLWQRLGSIRWGWILSAVLAQLGAITCSVIRWRRLLLGQGIEAPWRHLLGAFMIGRFFGAFTPGGWTGLNGYRVYDIAKHTGQTARAAATIGIEMLLGQLSFGVVVIIGSIFGAKYIGWQGVLLVDTFFVGLTLLVLGALARPHVFRSIGKWVPQKAQGKIQSSVDAICAYQGQGRLLVSAFLLGVGTHTFNTLVFVASARALNANLKPWDVFFVSAMQIFATLIPASVNGIGLREGTAVALYSRVGVPLSLATLIPLVGFAVEMFVSIWGGVVLAFRAVDYHPDIRVTAPDIQEKNVETVMSSKRPNPVEACWLGASAGCIAGYWLALIESARLVMTSRQHDWSVLLYGGVFYALIFALMGAIAGWLLATWRKSQGAPRREPALALARYAASLFSLGFFMSTAFLIRRDVFHETLKFKSIKGLAVLASVACVAWLLYLGLVHVLYRLCRTQILRAMTRSWGGPLIFLVHTIVAWTVSTLLAHNDPLSTTRRAVPSLQAGVQTQSTRPSVILIVVDTLRADHLPAWGYPKGSTPALDAFAKDAIRFEHAFANASWTRPSFATILSGRFPSSHRTMAKMDALPDAVYTLPEHLRSLGYATAGIVTNYNIAPFFNFQQGFDHYQYLEPEFILGANDTAAKLLWVQAIRNKIESWRASTGKVRPGAAYQDAEAVNRAATAWLARRPDKTPFFLFVAYMDPHDPYFRHPYSGEGYARAAHATPHPRESAHLQDLYDGEISYWDTHFGNLIRTLKTQQVYDNSIIVVTSDHGEEFGEHGGFWHGTTLYDEQIHVPLFIKLPRHHSGALDSGSSAANKNGSVETQWVQHVDIAPSILLLLGQTPPKDMQGGNLFVGTEQTFAEESHEGNVLSSLRAKTPVGERKLIEANKGNPRGLAPVELYRIESDPKERDNVAESEPSVVATQATALRETQHQIERNAPLRKSVDIANDTRTVDKLRALGYGN